MVNGLVSFPPKILPDKDFPFYRFFGVLVFAGAGGCENPFYTFYFRNKGIGMGQRFRCYRSTFDANGSGQTAPGTFSWKLWKTKNAFATGPDLPYLMPRCFIGLTSVVTLFLFMFAVLAALYPQALGFAQDNLIWDLSGMLGEAMGTFAGYLLSS